MKVCEVMFLSTLGLRTESQLFQVTRTTLNPDFQLDSTGNYWRLKCQPPLILILNRAIKYSRIVMKLGKEDGFMIESLNTVIFLILMHSSLNIHI